MFSELLTWFFEELKIFSTWLLGNILEGFAAVLNAIPLPDFLLNIPSYTLPPSVSFYAQYFEIEFGFTVLVSAYTIRFILRRIPFIG